MLVGRGRGPGQANIHATVPGRVVRIVSWKTPEGAADALVIRLEGAFEKLGRREEIFPWEGLSPFELRRLIAEYGIVEMERAGRPLHDLLASVKPPSQTAQTAQDGSGPLTLVVRCVFDDPWLAADRALCRERLRAVAEGALITARASRADRILFALSREEAALGEEFLAAAGPWNFPCSLALVGSRYPQRNCRELELVLRSYEKKEGEDLGALLFLGPATMAAVHDAVKLKKPILDRYVAVGGSAVRNPQVMKVRVGTRLREVFAECGGFVERPRRIALGSPLLGREVENLDEPVAKTCRAVFALREGRDRKVQPWNCTGCGECRNVCPVGLDPEELFKRLDGTAGGDRSRDFSPRTLECHGCGCCEVVCPSSLPLSSVIFAAALRGN
jgi:electron transport complex protein RnfC